MINKHLLTTCIFGVWIIASSFAENNDSPYNQILLGPGTSHPGWGETDERVQTVDFVFRHCRPFFKKETGRIKGSHEFWIETPLAIILSDSDSSDSNDIGIIGLNFLFVWIFPDTRVGEPYLMAGGGPQYIMADIDGVGADLCGNYQVGAGVRLNLTEEQPINLELRYHHISNLGFAEPNVPINSTKAYIGFMLPF